MPPHERNPTIVPISFRVGGDLESSRQSELSRALRISPGKRTNTEKPRMRFTELTGKINIQMPDYATRVGDIRRWAAIKEFKSNYEQISTTGGPAEGTEGYTNDYCNLGQCRRRSLEKERPCKRICADGSVTSNGSR